MGKNLGQKATEGGPDVGVRQPGGDRLGDPDGLGLLDHDVLHFHRVRPFECSDMRFHAAQTFLFLADSLFQLSPAQPQHSSQLIGRDVFRESFPDLVQTKAHITQRDDSVK